MSRIFGGNNKNKQKFSNNNNNSNRNDDDDEMDEATSGFFGSINGTTSTSNNNNNNNNKQQLAYLEGATDQTKALQQKQLTASSSSVLGKRGAAKREAMSELAARGGAGVKVEGVGLGGTSKTVLPAIGTRVIHSEDEWKTEDPLARETAEKKMLSILKKRYLEKEVEKRRNKGKASRK